MRFYKLKFTATLLFAFIVNATLWAQTPEKMSYQAVVRDANGDLLVNQQVGLKISILKGAANGSVVYTETQTPTTNENGLFSVAIGGGSGFSTIDWGSSTYFIKTETDPAGGTNYSISGTSQLLSVPYALHAKTAGGMTPGNAPGEMQYWNGSEWTIVPAGNEGNVLTFVNNTPTWMDPTATFGTVTNPVTGRVWMDRNLGATQVATSSTDEASYGGLYQWGRLTDGHEVRTSGTTSTLSNSDVPGHGNYITNTVYPTDWRSPQNDNLWQGVDGVNNPCPSGFRLPTVSEWEAEIASWDTQDNDGAFGSVLKLPATGFRFHDDGNVILAGEMGFYWAQEAFGDQARSAGFGSSSSNTYVGADRRGMGFAIRCIKD